MEHSIVAARNLAEKCFDNNTVMLIKINAVAIAERIGVILFVLNVLKFI